MYNVNCIFLYDSKSRLKKKKEKKENYNGVNKCFSSDSSSNPLAQVTLEGVCFIVRAYILKQICFVSK